VVKAVRERVRAGFAVSVTTREHRPDELDGVDYSFVSDAEFDDLIDSGRLLEWASYGGHRYGTPVSEVERVIGDGDDVILDIENEGARQIRTRRPDATLIFVLPPSPDELERRLRARGDTSEPDIRRRLAVAEQQIADAETLYDHHVVNDRLDTAISQVVSILGSPSPPRRDAPAPSDPEDRTPRSQPTT
jgi:guanylate kinase